MYQIRKLFKFEMAHVLTKAYTKDCCKIHGHSYKMEVFISSDCLNKDGMVIDFKKLKEIVKKEILSKFDHAFVCQQNNNILGYDHAILTPYNPTAENMAAHFCHILAPKLKPEIPSFVSLTVRLHETDTGWAEFQIGG